MRLQDVANHAGEKRRFAAAAPLVAGRKPVPALVRIRSRRLRRIKDEEAFGLRQLVHSRAGREVVGVLRAAVEHDDERQGLAAMDYARRAVDAGDRPAEALLTLGVVHYKRGEYDAARRAMRQAIAADPRQVDALRWLATEAAAVGDLLTQYQMMIRVFDAAPLDPFYLPDLERVLVKNLGDPLRMAALMERALALDPANAEAQAQLKRALALLAAPGGNPRRSPPLAALSARPGETK